MGMGRVWDRYGTGMGWVWDGYGTGMGGYGTGMGRLRDGTGSSTISQLCIAGRSKVRTVLYR